MAESSINLFKNVELPVFGRFVCADFKEKKIDSFFKYYPPATTDAYLLGAGIFFKTYTPKTHNMSLHCPGRGPLLMLRRNWVV